MATRAVLRPFDAEFPSANFPALARINDRPVLGFDATTAETCYWTLVAPQGLTGTVSLVVSYCMASATTGTVDFEVQVEAITSGDSTNLGSATSFDTANTITAPTVPGTAGFMAQFTCTLSSVDSASVADYLRISLKRDAADATNDTATGDAYVIVAELRDGA